MNKRFVIDWWPTFPGSQFFVADKSGGTAAIELIDGQWQVVTGKDMPVPVLTNDAYPYELNNATNYNFMGGTKNFGSRLKWNERFAKAAYLLKSYDQNTSPIYYSWAVLDSIKPGQWQVVADLKKSIVYFRTDIAHEVKSIDLTKCDFSLRSQIKYIEINSKSKGDVADSLTNLTVEINDNYVAKGFPIGYNNDKFSESEDFVNLKINLDRYCNSLLRQLK